MISESQRYHRNPDFIYRSIVEEAMLVPVHQDVADMDAIYTLNEAGSFIWERLEQPASQEELQAAMLEAYDADPEVLAADLGRFLDELTGIGALRMD